MPKRKATTDLRRMTKRRRIMPKKRMTRMLVRRNSPFPEKNLFKMRYCETVQINPGITTPAWHIFRANSIHDPNQTGIGHQPYGHDQVAALYNHYVVLGSKITVTYITESTNSINGGVMCGIALKDDTNVEGNFDTIREAKFSKYRIVNFNKTATLKHWFSSKKFFSGFARDKLRTAFGSNPAEEAYYQVYVVGTNAADPSPVNCIVTIDYIVMAEELKDLGTS